MMIKKIIAAGMFLALTFMSMASLATEPAVSTNQANCSDVSGYYDYMLDDLKTRIEGDNPVGAMDAAMSIDLLLQMEADYVREPELSAKRRKEMTPKEIAFSQCYSDYLHRHQPELIALQQRAIEVLQHSNPMDVMAEMQAIDTEGHYESFTETYRKRQQALERGHAANEQTTFIGVQGNVTASTRYRSP